MPLPEDDPAPTSIGTSIQVEYQLDDFEIESSGNGFKPSIAIGGNWKYIRLESNVCTLNSNVLIFN